MNYDNRRKPVRMSAQFFAMVCACLLTGCNSHISCAAPSSDAATPVARQMADDMREIHVSAEVKYVGVPSITSISLLRYTQPQIIPSGAFLDYDMYIDPSSIGASGGFHLESIPRLELMLRGAGIEDQYGNVHPANEVRAAVGKWCHRHFSLQVVAGKPFQLALIGAEFTPSHTGTYKAAYRNIRIVDGQGLVYWSIYPKLGELSACVPIESEGAASVTLPGAVGVSLIPSCYALAAKRPSTMEVAVHNYDPNQAHSVNVKSIRLESGGAHVVLADSIATTVAAGQTKTVNVAIPDSIAPGNYTAMAEVTSAGETATVRSQAINVGTNAAKLPDAAHYLAKGQFSWGADMVALPGVETYAELRQNGGNNVDIFASWGRVETSPGVYDFAYLDRAVAAARQTNMRAVIVFITEGKEYPAWLKSESMLDQNGKPGSVYAMSYYAPKGIPEYMKLIDAVTARYKSSDTVVAYTFAAGGWNDGFFYRPSHTEPGLYDYSPWSQAAFRSYVRDELHLTLAQASARYGVSLGAWNDLKQPVYQGGIDVRPIWWDFQNFRCWTVENSCENVCKAVRKNDPTKRVELLWGGDEYATGQIANDYDAAARVARKYGASVHNTCYEGYSGAPLLGTYTRDWGIVHTCETSGTPATVPIHQQAMFELLKYGSKGYSWVGGRMFGYYPSFSKLRSVATELSDARPFGPRLAVLQSVSYAQCSLRNCNSSDAVADTYKFADNQSLLADLYTDRSFLADGHNLDPKANPVIMDCADPVLAAQAADALSAYVHSGGVLIVHATSGKLTPGSPDERYRLLTSVGDSKAADLPDVGGPGKAAGMELLAGKDVQFTHAAPLVSLPAGAIVLAAFGDGQPAIATWDSGKGHVVLLGGYPNYSDRGTRAALASLLASYGVKPQSLATGVVVTATLASGATRYVVLHNPSGRAVATTVTTDGIAVGARSYDLLARQSIQALDWSKGVVVNLEPYEVTAIAIDGPGAPARTFPALDYP